MEITESRISVEDQIMNQRRNKVDRMLIPQPFLEKIKKIHDAILTIHVGFVFTWMVSAGISPGFAKFIASLVSPIADAMFFVYRGYVVQDHFYGSMGNGFYKNVVGEAFFAGIFCGALYAAIYVCRYWNRPWRFSQFLLEQIGTKASWLALFFFLLFASLVGFIIGLELLSWYGVLGVDEGSPSIAVIQLGVWSMFVGGVVSIFILVSFSIISGLLFFLKKIGKLFFD